MVTISACRSGGLQLKFRIAEIFGEDFSSFALFNHGHSSGYFHFQTQWRPKQLVNEEDENTRAA